MSDIHISWPEYRQTIEQLAVRVYQSGWEFDQIVCLARGGLRLGDLLSRIYEKPLAILATSSYNGSGGRVRGNLKIARHLSAIADNLGSRVLLVDDLVDSGISLEQTVGWLQQHYAADIQEIRTAVLWYKACSKFKPDYYVDYLPDNPWIHQPFERYEQLKIEELSNKLSAVSG